METKPATIKSGSRPWTYFILGALLAIAGPVAYAIQISMHRLMMPWYVPIMATLGVVLMIISVWQRRGIVRIALLLLFALFCAFIWMGVFGTRTPKYTGPAIAGTKLPNFSATLASGERFTDDDLKQGSPSVLIFFRGHW